jgi:hypothetical protein
MKGVKRLDLAAALFEPAITLLALVGLFVGLALKTDIATALIVLCSVLLIDLGVLPLLEKRAGR